MKKVFIAIGAVNTVTAAGAAGYVGCRQRRPNIIGLVDFDEALYNACMNEANQKCAEHHDLRQAVVMYQLMTFGR